MLEQAADALNRRDYKTAAKLIATLVANKPDDHQVQLYAAQLQEATNKLDNALEIYRLLLQHAINPKITTEARQGIQRIEQMQSQIQATALAAARAGIEDNIEPGFLILEPMSQEHKQATVKKFAEIMDLDPYSARLQLPSRGWRLYRLGKMGELEFYRNQLQAAGIPCFCVSQHDTQQMFVFRVSHFQSFYPQASIVCLDDRAELRTFNFKWSEVTQIVMGMVPIFEEVMEIDARNRTHRKPKTLDYVHICDLQLRDRRSIFRLCSQTYDFCDYKQLITQNRTQFTGDLSSQLSGDLSGLLNGERIPSTSRDNWKNLMSQIQKQVPDIQTQSDFIPFAETAIGYPELLMRIAPHIELLRRADSPWDRAFQLYSTLSMCKEKNSRIDLASTN
jgi:tetratricopeptide (TPR) repeat protein